jgi:hypothetical protein
VTAPGRVMVIEGEWVKRKAPRRREYDQDAFIKAVRVEALENGREPFY